MNSHKRAGLKPKLLFLCQNLPFPPDGGGMIRSYHTLRLLSLQYDVTALCFARRSSRSTPEAIELARDGLLRMASRVEVFPIPQDHSRLRFVADHVRSLLTRRAYTRWTYESRECRALVEELLAMENFAAVHLDSLDLVGYLPAFRRERVAVAHHNIESQLLTRRADSQPALRRAYLRLQARLTEKEEARWCPAVAMNITVSHEDSRTLASVAPGCKITVAPNGVDTRSFTPFQGEVSREIVFVGGHTWFPNRHGMEHFVECILPRIREVEPSIPVTWVGRASQPIMDRMASLGVVMTGYVPDIRPYVSRAACFIVPIYVGGGTRLKILDAWAMGKAVVSTPIGCEGLLAKPGDNIVTAASDKAFADAVSLVLDDQDFRRRIERGGRETAERHYDWSVIGESMLAAYEGIATGREGETAI